MSQPSAVASASFARSSRRCQLWTSLRRFPSGFSRLWSGPATKPSSEIDMWQVVSGIGVLQVIAICKRRHRTAREGGSRASAMCRGTCDCDQMPTEKLEDAILARWLAVLEREPMVREAISSAFEELEAEQPRREAELSRIDAARGLLPPVRPPG